MNLRHVLSIALATAAFAIPALGEEPVLHAIADQPKPYRDCVRQAAGILGRLYGGVDTYRTDSARKQILHNQMVEAINQTRAACNLPNLQE